MYIHLGNDILIKNSDIIGIFDLENASVSKITKQFLSENSKSANVITVSYEMPKSFIVTQKEEKIYIYISQISAGTLKKRSLKY